IRRYARCAANRSRTAGRWSRGSCAYESLLGSSDGGTFNYDIWPENRVRPEIRVRPLFQGNRGQTPFGNWGQTPFVRELVPMAKTVQRKWRWKRVDWVQSPGPKPCFPREAASGTSPSRAS